MFYNISMSIVVSVKDLDVKSFIREHQMSKIHFYHYINLVKLTQDFFKSL